MRIGELSQRCGVPVRMLRYYEQRGLLTPSRSANGYREYGEADVDRAALVSSLIRSGLPTKLIIPLLHDRSGDDSAAAARPDDLLELLVAESERLRARIDCMSLSRNTIEAYLRKLGAAEPVVLIAS